MQFPPCSCYLLSLRYKYSFKQSVLEHPQSIRVSGLCPSSNIPNITQRFGNWICFRPQERSQGVPPQLVPLDRAELSVI
jgi:hypothetical protein